jgi:hypothetical protein
MTTLNLADAVAAYRAAEPRRRAAQAAAAQAAGLKRLRHAVTAAACACLPAAIRAQCADWRLIPAGDVLTVRCMFDGMACVLRPYGTVQDGISGFTLLIDGVALGDLFLPDDGTNTRRLIAALSEAQARRARPSVAPTPAHAPEAAATLDEYTPVREARALYHRLRRLARQTRHATPWDTRRLAWLDDLTRRAERLLRQRTEALMTRPARNGGTA